MHLFAAIQVHACKGCMELSRRPYYRMGCSKCDRRRSYTEKAGRQICVQNAQQKNILLLCCLLQRSDKRLVFKCAQQVELHTTLLEVCTQSVEYRVGISTRRLKRVWLEEMYNLRPL